MPIGFLCRAVAGEPCSRWLPFGVSGRVIAGTPRFAGVGRGGDGGREGVPVPSKRRMEG